MNRNKQLMGAVLIVLGLMCLLSVMLPMGYGLWSDAYLLSADVERPVIDGSFLSKHRRSPSCMRCTANEFCPGLI